MDITKNLQIETRRLDSLGIRFRMYEHREEEICIVIRKIDCTEDNSTNIIKAGYTYKCERNDMDAVLYKITVPRLKTLNNAMIRLVELESKRLKTLGNIWFRYKFSEMTFLFSMSWTMGKLRTWRELLPRWAIASLAGQLKET